MRYALLFALCSCDVVPDSSDPTPSPFSDSNGEATADVIRAMLEAHNDVRNTAEPPPQPALQALTWSDALAADALAWAEQCQFEHSTVPEGENLYASTQQTAPEAVVTAWADEAAFYDFATDSCSDVCGHYTQVVWRDTAQVGCGAAWCANLFNGMGGQYWVCRYDPAGNWVGERPY